MITPLYKEKHTCDMLVIRVESKRQIKLILHIQSASVLSAPILQTLIFIIYIFTVDVTDPFLVRNNESP